MPKWLRYLKQLRAVHQLSSTKVDTPVPHALQGVGASTAEPEPSKITNPYGLYDFEGRFRKARDGDLVFQNQTPTEEQ